MTTKRSAMMFLLGMLGLGTTQAGCIGDDLWQQYNLGASSSTCQVDSECESGICRAGRCQSSHGAVGLNCRDDKDCDSGLCIAIGNHTQGICFNRCSSSKPRCAPQATCYPVMLSTAGEAAQDQDMCLLRCLTDSDCDTFGGCVLYEGSSEGYCLPR